MSLNLKQFGIVSLGGMVLIILGFYSSSLFTQHGTERVEEHLKVEVNNLIDIVVPLVAKIEHVKYDVVQVQQWLQDISATRGLDGLNDGFDEAQNYAVRFQADIIEVIHLAKTMQLNEVVDAAKDVQRAFPAFFETGREMAESYVAEGPAGGNPHMAGFDKKAEVMAKALNNSTLALDHLIKQISQQRKETLQEAESQRVFSSMVAFIMLLFSLGIIGIIGYVGTSAIKAILSLSASMNIVKKGQITERILHIRRKDEIGQMQHGFNDLMDLTEFFIRDAGACMQAFSQSRFERKILPDGLTGRFREVAHEINNGIEVMSDKNGEFAVAGSSFETGVKANFDSIRDSMSSLQQSSEALLGLADDSNREAEVVAEATSNSMSGVQAVATATEELSASIQEIGRQVSSSAELVNESAEEAQNASEKIKELSEASIKIGDVVEIISGIAEQTNLLALNATIESARAGEAGKGFAVVAQEVKALAAQTGSATDEVRAQVETIQTQTQDAVQVIEVVSNRMKQVNEAVTAIAAAVEEQGAATNEISSSIVTVSTETKRMSEAVELLQTAIIKTRKSANEMNSSTGVVNDVSGTVATDIDSFMDTMKAATG